MLTIRARKAIVASVFAIVMAVPVVSPAADALVADTVVAQQAVAKSYGDKAAAYRQTAEENKQRAAVYATADVRNKDTARRSANLKKQRHYEKLAALAEKLAADAEKSAALHTRRAQELQVTADQKAATPVTPGSR